MEATHIFNENLRRLEPIHSKCVFCDSYDSKNINDNVFVFITKVTDRTEAVVYHSVKWKQLEVGAARCPHCKEKHKKSTVVSNLWATVISIFLFSAFIGLGLLLAVLINSFVLFPVLCFACAFFSVLLSTSTFRINIRNRIIHKKSILTEEDGLKKYPIVQDLLNNGYKFGKPA
jgi:hypothetical protein